jgi:hypothetical protein
MSDRHMPNLDAMLPETHQAPQAPRGPEAGAGSSGGPFQTFHRFRELPTEIQLIIWHFAASAGTRAASIKLDLQLDERGSPRRPLRIELRPLSSHYPGLARACKDSNAIYRTHHSGTLRLGFSDGRDMRVQHFNLADDMVIIQGFSVRSVEGLSLDRSIPSESGSYTIKGMDRVQRLVLALAFESTLDDYGISTTLVRPFLPLSSPALRELYAGGGTPGPWIGPPLMAASLFFEHHLGRWDKKVWVSESYLSAKKLLGPAVGILGSEGRWFVKFVRRQPRSGGEEEGDKTDQE